MVSLGTSSFISRNELHNDCFVPSCERACSQPDLKYSLCSVTAKYLRAAASLLCDQKVVSTTTCFHISFPKMASYHNNSSTVDWSNLGNFIFQNLCYIVIMEVLYVFLSLLLSVFFCLSMNENDIRGLTVGQLYPSKCLVYHL